MARRFAYPLENEIFVTVRIREIRGKWVREVRPTPEFTWNDEDVEMLREAVRCHNREWYIGDECNIDWERVREAEEKVRKAVVRWLEALKKEYEPTGETILSGEIWRHKSKNLFIVPLVPWVLIRY